jgi:hypothetical protein
MPGLSLSDPGFDYAILSEFRMRPVVEDKEQRLLEKLLDRCEELGRLKGKTQQRTDFTDVVAAV